MQSLQNPPINWSTYRFSWILPTVFSLSQLTQVVNEVPLRGMKRSLRSHEAFALQT